MIPNLKIISSVSGKFGIKIQGEIDGTYFNVVCSELDNGRRMLYEIESNYNHIVLRETLIWYGHVDM